MTLPLPQCGQSDRRNQDYRAAYTPHAFWRTLVARDDPTIFDIGGHRGESVLFFRAIYPRARILSFEPEPENFRHLQAVCAHHASAEAPCTAYPLAMAETPGKRTFYAQDISHLGSLRPINRASRDSLGYAAKAPNHGVEVEVTSLDRFCANGEGGTPIAAIDLLKIDVQGYEIGVLQGAAKMLKQTACCTLEVSLYDFYGEASSLLAVESAMQAAGLQLWDVAKVSKNPNNLRTDWVELVYSRGSQATP